MQLHALPRGADLDHHRLLLPLRPLEDDLVLIDERVGVALQNPLDRRNADDEVALTPAQLSEIVEDDIALRVLQLATLHRH